jgi:branched-chain amino acid aminotransferase
VVCGKLWGITQQGRVMYSAGKLGLRCPLSVDDMEALAREGVAKFPADA